MDAAMHALESRSAPTVLTSFTNKAMLFFSTRKVMVNMMGGQSPPRPAAQLKA